MNKNNSLTFGGFRQPVLGKLVQRPAKLNADLAEELKSLSTQDDPFETHIGQTMCTYDFYEGNI